MCTFYTATGVLSYSIFIYTFFFAKTKLKVLSSSINFRFEIEHRWYCRKSVGFFYDLPSGKT